MPTINIPLNTRYGKLVVIARNGSSKNGEAKWQCKCDCGNFTTVASYSLRKKTRSCGCLWIDAISTHKMTNTASYKIWESMKQRCFNPNATHYASYGGRGITVCTRWLDFAVFYADMGDRPNNTSIERIDNDRGYSPGNCIWATQQEQCRNTRRSRYITFHGKTQCLEDWAKELNILVPTLRKRLKNWTLEDAMTKPLTASYQRFK